MSAARRVLNTRPQDDAGLLTERLIALGREVVCEPLLEMHFPSIEAPTSDSMQAVLFTSRNGVRAFARASDNRSILAFCVGDSTAALAREFGFERVESAGGDVSKLVDLVASDARPDAGTLIHIAGSVSAGNLVGELQSKGFICQRTVMYESRERQRFSTRTIEFMQHSALSEVVLFSPRSARTFVKLTEYDDLAHRCSEITAFCLSPAVADVIEKLGWREMKIASEPSLESLLTLFHTLEGDAHNHG